MKNLTTFLALPCFLLLATPAPAHWPTTVEENIAVAADPDTFETYPKALSLPGNRTLITYREQTNGSGFSYQILDRFGNMMFPDGQPVMPNQLGYLTQVTHRLISDGAGGAVAACVTFSPVEGIYAQRLDSLGNRLWGDDGAQIFFREDQEFDICWDGQDGFWLAVTPNGQPYVFHMYLQHIDGQGNLLLGDSGLVVQIVPQGINWPYVVPDGEGGCIAVWEDSRISPNAIVAQRYNPAGHPVWSEDLVICTDVWWKSTISDGEGGVIVQAGSSYNRHWRVNGAGQILWTRDHLSWWQGADMVLGEPGYFYVGFYHVNVFWAQRMTLTGHNLWPTYGSGQYGAPLCTSPPPPWGIGWRPKIHFQSPYLFAIYSYEQQHALHERFFAQKLDTTGAMQWGAMGTLLASVMGYNEEYHPVPASESGYVAVWERDSLGAGYDVYAKRVNADGTLGGPFPLGVTLTPHNPPIQIPASGGTFTFDLAIADSDSVGGVMDAWIEATLPNGSTLEILARDDLAIQPNGVMTKNDLQQVVPASAPPGVYTYTAYAGNYPYQSPWGQDSFTFEKMGARGWGLGAGNEGWTLSGWDQPVRGAQRVEAPAGAAPMPKAVD